MPILMGIHKPSSGGQVRPQDLVRDHCGPAHMAMAQIQHAANNGVPGFAASPTPPFVVRVKVQLVPVRVGPAMCPPLSIPTKE
jgi:hypothetical protein